LLLVLANDLVDRDRIRMTLRGTTSDRAAFVITVLGTWILPLDQAIYLGIGISIILFLRRARLLTIREMIIGEKGRFREIDPEAGEAGRSCLAIRIMNLTGPLFFAVAGELEAALEALARNLAVRVLILRLRQAQDIDVTTASVLEATAQKLANQGRTLILLGLRRPALALLEQTGISERIGQENIFPTQVGWFTAMEAALRRALALTGEHACGTQCPLAEYLAVQDALRAATEIPAPTLPGLKQNG
jgi:SulP family sulfate permease